jgi:hypothetical protein
MQARAVPAIAALALAALGSCGRDPVSTAPRPHSIRGRVTLVGSIVDAGGTFVGHRTVQDADGVTVELHYGSQLVGRTRTVDGIYTFSDLAPGAYVVRTSMAGLFADQTVPLTIANVDVFSGDDLHLASFGDLYPVPNPIGAETLVYFQLPEPDTQYVEIRLWDAAGDSVRTLLRGRRPPGLNQVRWDGTDRNDVPVTGQMFWVTMTGAPYDVRAQLLFRSSALARPSFSERLRTRIAARPARVAALPPGSPASGPR